MTIGPETWAPPESAKGTVAWTRTWRIVTYESAGTPAARLYLALAPECLTEAYEMVFSLLDGEGISHRHARSPEVLHKAEAHPGWAGKAVVIEPGGQIALDDLTAELDTRLAGRGLSGPSVLTGARPLGGKSGLIFIYRAVGTAEVDDRRQRLAKLLGN